MSGKNSKKRKKVLVVDDSLTVRVYHSSLLRSLGFDVDMASNGLEALEKCMQEKYDLIFSDINMPVMDGYTFVRKLRKLDDYKEIPVVFVTTMDDENEKKKGLLAGANLYVVKPIDNEVLKVILESLGEVGYEEGVSG